MSLRVGLRAAKEGHDLHPGLGYFPFNLKKEGDTAIIRVLAKAEPPYDGEGNPQPEEGVRYIENLYMHRYFPAKLKMRCLAEGDDPDTDKCPACRVKMPRSLRTYIPVRVRDDQNANRVQWIEYGRNGLQEIIAQVEELEDEDITGIDFKIKRIGKDLETQYKWIPIMRSARPLSTEELALEFENPSDFIPLKTYEEGDRIAMEYERATSATKVNGKPRSGNDDDEEEEDDIPF